MKAGHQRIELRIAKQAEWFETFTRKSISLLMPNQAMGINYLKLKIQVEKEIALNNDTLHIFEHKWKNIKLS